MRRMIAQKRHREDYVQELVVELNKAAAGKKETVAGRRRQSLMRRRRWLKRTTWWLWQIWRRLRRRQLLQLASARRRVLDCETGEEGILEAHTRE